MTTSFDRRQLMAGFAAGIVAGPALAQSTPPETPLIPRKSLFDDPDRTSVQISRDLWLVREQIVAMLAKPSAT